MTDQFPCTRVSDASRVRTLIPKRASRQPGRGRMETRRIRRLERRRVHRITVLYAAVAVIGVAVGVALPQSTTLSVALFAVAACSLVVVAMRGESTAPLHGLHRVVRLPLRTSASATLESFGSRLAGSARALVRLDPAPVPVVLDEPDDEAESWWGPVTAPLTPPAAAPPAPSTPVVAAAMASARVASDGT